MEFAVENRMKSVAATTPVVLAVMLIAAGAAIATVGAVLYPPIEVFTVTAVTRPTATVELARVVCVPPAVLPTVTVAFAA